MKIGRFVFQVVVFAQLSLFSLNSFSQGQGVTLVHVNDWGSGFIAQFQYVITDDDVALDNVRDWRWEANYQGAASLSNAWMGGYSGTVKTGSLAPDGGFAITNDGVGYRPELGAGHTLFFNVQGQGSGFQPSDFSPEFINLTELPTNEFTSTLVNVNDWFNPAWGGGFNATFRCDVEGPDTANGPVTDLLIEFNYSGGGTPSTAWTQSHNGPIEYGFIAPDGGYAISNLGGFQPELYAGDSVTFAIQVQGAGFLESDFDIVCSDRSGSGGNQNTPPVATPIAVELVENGSATFELIGSDDDGDTLSYQVDLPPEFGQYTLNGSTVVYTPTVGFSGSDSLVYSVNDGSDSSLGAVVQITVDPVNDPPVAFGSSYEVVAGEQINITLEAEDADGDALAYAITTASQGSTQLNGNSVTYTADATGVNTDTFSFTADDGTDVSAPANVTIAILMPNRAPAITSLPQSTVEERVAYEYQIVAVDADDDDLTYELVSGPNTGAIDTSTGVFTSTHLSSLIGSVREQNQVCVGPMPDRGEFDPVEKWSWDQGAVLSQPMVVPLTDTNGDGVINTADDSTILAVTWTGDGGSGRLVAVDGATGSTNWITESDFGSGTSVAVGDLEGDGIPEVVGVSNNGKTIVLDNLGNVKWTSEYPDSSRSNNTYGAPTIADLDGDGLAEILMRGSVLNSDGSLRFKHPDALWHAVIDVAADLDGDGFQEVLTGGRVYDRFGSELWRISDAQLPRSYAVFDVDGDDIPEIAVASVQDIRLLRNDGTLVWKIDEPSRNPNLLSVGDINGDGLLEIVGFANRNISAFDAATGEKIWSEPALDGSHLTGVALFDFDGDGVLEVVHGGESLLRIFDGKNGEILFQIANSSATAAEAPTVADIDGDGHAEIVVTTSSRKGIRVFEDRNDTWVGTRALWNQYAYYVDNINDDLSVPSGVGAGVSMQNTYLTNFFPDQDALGLPDLAVFELTIDPADDRVFSFEIHNRGIAPTRTPSIVEIFDGDPSHGGTLIVSVIVPALGAGEAETVVVTDDAISTLGDTVFVRVDHANSVNECNDLNNVSSAHIYRVRVSDPDGLSSEQRFSVTATDVNEPPTIITESLPSVTQGSDFTATVDATDPDQGDGLTFSLSGAPTGMNINSVNGSISWDASDFIDTEVSFSVVVTDLRGLSDEKTYTISAVGAPSFVSVPSATGFVGVPYDYAALATDPTPQDVLSYRLVNSPSSATIDTATGMVRWTPEESDLGENSFEIEAVDTTGNVARQVFSVSVSMLPVAVSRAVITPEDTELAINLASTDDGALSYTIVSQPINGVLTGEAPNIVYTPDENYFGHDSFEYIVGDGATTSDVGRIDIEIEPINDPPIILNSAEGPVLPTLSLTAEEPLLLNGWDTVDAYINTAAGSTPSWRYSEDRREVVQRGNSYPQVLLSPEDSKNRVFRGTVRVNTTSDDDFLGFVFGWTDPNSLYLLRHARLSLPLFRGFYLYRVDLDGELLRSPGPDFFPAQGSFANPGESLFFRDIPWAPLTDYEYTIAHLSGVIAIQVRAGYEIIASFVVEDDAFEGGKFGFFNSSQDATQFSYFTTQELSSNQFTFDLDVKDVDSTALSYTLIDGPDGLSIDSVTGEIDWDVSSVNSGTYTIHWRVTDDLGAADEQFLVLTVDASSPFILSNPPQTALGGETYRYQVLAVDMSLSGPLNYELVSGPVGSSIDSATGEFLWTPEVDFTETVEVSVRVTSSSGASTVQTFNLSIAGNGFPPPSITLPLTATGIEDEDLIAFFGASNPSGQPLSFEIDDAPDHGTAIVEGDRLTYVPDENFFGSDSFVYRAVSDGVSSEPVFGSLSINPVNDPPTLLSDPSQEIRLGDGSYSYQVVLADIDSIEFEFTLISGPDGMAIDSDGLLTWTPSASGLVAVEILIRDENATLTRGWGINVLPSNGPSNSPNNQAPEILSSPPLAALIGQSYEYPIIATDPDGNSLVYTLVAGPDGSSMDTNGLVTWVPTAV